MYLRRAIQVSIVLIWWLVIVPLISKYLESIRWMRRGKWPKKKLGLYGIAALAFIFIYSFCMYAYYTLYKHWERKIRTDMKQSVSKAAESEVPSAATSMATVAELEPLKHIRPTCSVISSAPLVNSASAELLTKKQQLQEQQQQQQRPTGARSKVKILSSAHKNPPPPPPTAVIVTTPLVPLQAQPYGYRRRISV